MIRTAPIATATRELPTHPAVRAWEALGGAAPARVDHLRRATRTKPALYRLDFGPAGQPGVFAKHAPAEALAPERRVYERVLPQLAVTAPRFHGAFDDADATTWLFVEDVGEVCYSPHDPTQRALAARWLGQLHASAAALAPHVPLPDAGPSRYLANLRAARAEILQHQGNRALSADDRSVLGAILAQGERLEARWTELERACGEFPVTLVHADFQPKNMRLRVTDGALTLYPIDWETAGWGVPAADLAHATRRRRRPSVDPEVYAATVRETLPGIDAASVERLALLGHVFQSLAGILWSCADLRFESEACLIRPVSSMRVYLSRIDDSLEAAAPWLR